MTRPAPAAGLTSRAIPTPTNAVRRDRRGATIVLIVVLSTFLIGLVAFAVDVSWMYVVRSQTQSAVDAGAIAAGLSLREYPEDVEQARLYAEHFVQLNAVGRQAVVPTDAITVETGTWLESSSDFRPGGADPKSVRVVADAANEPLAFGGIFNRTTFRVDREAVAVGGGTPMDIIMTLDLSGSMGSQGRIEALRAAAPTFVDVILGVSDDDRIGVMGYGALLGSYDPIARGHDGTIYTSGPLSGDENANEWVGVLEAELTYDLAGLRDSVLTTRVLVANKYNGWTPVGGALRDSVHYLTASGRMGVGHYVVLMSDGRANKPNNNGPGFALEMADYAAANDVTVYTISLGNGADEALMEQIAARTEGEHFIASGSAGELSSRLTAAFREVAESIKRTRLVR